MPGQSRDNRRIIPGQSLGKLCLCIFLLLVFCRPNSFSVLGKNFAQAREAPIARRLSLQQLLWKHSRPGLSQGLSGRNSGALTDSLGWAKARDSFRRVASKSCRRDYPQIRKIRASIKIKSALPPPKKTQNTPPPP